MLRVFIILVIISECVFAQTDFTDVQTFIDSNITRNFLITALDNTHLSAAMNSKINFYHRQKRTNFYLKNFYSSSVTKLEENLFRDFDNIKTGAGYFVTENINVSANYLGQFFSDDKSFQIQGTSSNYMYLSGLYDGLYKGAQVYSTLNAGYKAENQLGEYNKGVSASGEFSVYNLDVSDFLVDSELKMGYESLDPRKKSMFYSRLYLDRSFQNDLARNEFDGMYSGIRKDFYFPADAVTKSQFGVDNNIEKRTERTFKALDKFDYTISDALSMFASVIPYYRTVDKENAYIPSSGSNAPTIFDTQVQELSMEGDFALNLNIGKLGSQFILSYKERDEKHFLTNPNRINQSFVKQIEKNEATKNNHTSLFRLASSLFYNVNDRNRVELTGNASILKYDTQSDENFDDRDELGMTVYAAHRFNNLKNLVLTTSLDLSLYHIVYVFSEKSSNNNWNRILRFTSRSFFTPSDNFRNIGTFSVIANYTVYDFEDIISTIQSYSFRQLNLKDSMIVNFTRHFGIDCYGELKLYERGELNWNAFSQRPVSYFEDKIINSELNYFFNKLITVSAGYNFFEQRRFNYVNGERVFDTYVITKGPFARLRYYWNNNSKIELLGSYDYYSYGDNTPGTRNSTFYLNASWNF
jgi:hypothetical protein